MNKIVPKIDGNVDGVLAEFLTKIYTEFVHDTGTHRGTQFLSR